MIRALVSAGLILSVLLIHSCDFSTHEYTSYEGINSQFQSDVYFGWDTEGDCFIHVEDTLLVFDEVEVQFLSNNSTFTSEYRTDTLFRYNEGGKVIIDTSLFYSYEFDIPEDDPLISQNDSVLVRFYLKGKQLDQDTLYKEIFTSDFIDRIPLPKLH